MSTSEILVEITDLVKIYDHEVIALDGLSLRIHTGEFLAIMGPSGSGKTTLLNLLAALDCPTRGEIRIAGEQITEIRDKDAFRSRTVGLVFQMHNLIPTLTARENIEVPMHEGRSPGATRRERAEALLQHVGLAGRGAHFPAKLSGGERQRVAIARALANSPDLLLADEPTGNLDSLTGREVMDVFSRLNREGGTTVLVVTHNADVARSTRRVVILRDGHIARDCPIEDPYIEDLRQFKGTQLGQALLEGTVPESVRHLGLGEAAIELQQVLTRV